MLSRPLRWLAAAGILARTAVAALPPVDFDDNNSIAAAAKLVAEDMLSFYPRYASDPPGWTLGILPGPPPPKAAGEQQMPGMYYWWHGGAMWGTLIDYRHRFGDKSFDKYITESLLHQTGKNNDFNPANWSLSMGNDDQAFWAMAALGAAETGYPDPPEDQPQWLALAQGTLHSQINPQRRIVDQSNPCNWGLRWQVFPQNNGYDYVNTISNGCFMNMAARTGRYTGNKTYLDLAERTYDLLKELKYIDENFEVHDGGHEKKQCKDINKLTFSYNAAILMQSCAYMYNVTNGGEKWKREIDGLLDRTIKSFFTNSSDPTAPHIAFERNCEYSSLPAEPCNNDMRTFKGYLHRWMASTMKMAPYTESIIMPVLRESARAALKTCTHGPNGRLCGFYWREGAFRTTAPVGQFPDTASMGEQMNVLGALMSVMKTETYRPPFTNTTGGTSGADYNAGLAGDEDPRNRLWKPITAADKAGAGIVTAVLIGAFASTMLWLNWDQMRGRGFGF
ncbi:mannan endo-1,6-alpha-mannosidase DCW1 [Microdochium bolleyi]|uniref:Mannan endo-1,6-alpha-mannosidase n=1 Tax=Microdochium bolleyi TaxID=196109 RepID=A0A136IYC8_9PEZI|nr:mannan endo-1,6-alpha-mannosidase DCW1 [Microdochium bolleyi]